MTYNTIGQLEGPSRVYMTLHLWLDLGHCFKVFQQNKFVQLSAMQVLINDWQKDWQKEGLVRHMHVSSKYSSFKIYIMVEGRLYPTLCALALVYH